jgi:hypothetical protein
MNTDKGIRQPSEGGFAVSVVIPLALDHTVDKTGVQSYFVLSEKALSL